MATQYIVQDRTTLTNVAIEIDDGQVRYVGTVSASSADPIFQDTVNSAINWKLFVSDNQLGWESTVTIQNDSVILADVTTATDYRLYIGDGEFYIDTNLIHPADRSFVPRLTLLGVG